MAKKYDVIVVGAGPAGFLAAKAAGENGLEVALLEKKADPTHLTRACGQSLISANEYYFRNLLRYNARDKRICFSSDGFSFKYDGPYQNVYSLAAFTPNGHKIEHGDYEVQKRKGDNGRVGIIYDKEASFRNLLEEVKACSVNVVPGINVQSVTAKADRVIVEGSGQSFEGRYVIAADGVNSRVAEVMGFNKDRYYYCNFAALHYYMTGLKDTKPDEVVLQWAYGKDGAFRCYIIPRPFPGEFNFAVITVDPRVNLEAAANYFLTEATVAPRFKNAKKLKAFSAICNCYSPILVPYKDRVLVAGDVGATQEMEITGAMISGWRAGQAISTAVQEENLGLKVTGISKYINWWQEVYVKECPHELYMTGISMPYILPTAEDINYIYGHITKPGHACWNPYTASTSFRESMAEALAITQKERPDIYKKMQRKSLPPKELLAEITKISKPVSS